MQPITALPTPLHLARSLAPPPREAPREALDAGPAESPQRPIGLDLLSYIRAHLARGDAGEGWDDDLAALHQRNDTRARQQQLATMHDELRQQFGDDDELLWAALDTRSAASPDQRRAVSALQEQLAAGALADDNGVLSDSLTDQILALLQRLDGEWLQRYSDILSNYVGFFNKLTEALKGLKDAITGNGKDGDINVNFDKVKKALRELKADEASLGLGGDFKTEADAKAFLEELGLSDLVVRVKADGTWELAVDPEIIDSLIGVFPGPGSMNPGRYNAIISAKDSLMERFNHINRVLPDRYQRQLQTWDTLVKALSGTIDAMAETNRAIAQNTA